MPVINTLTDKQLERIFAIRLVGIYYRESGRELPLSYFMVIRYDHVYSVIPGASDFADRVDAAINRYKQFYTVFPGQGHCPDIKSISLFKPVRNECLVVGVHFFENVR